MVKVVHSLTAKYSPPDQAATPHRPNPTCLSFETCLMKLNSKHYEDVQAAIAVVETVVFCRSEKVVLVVSVLMTTRE